MKLRTTFSLLFAMVFALTMTLPAYPNTGPPAPTTENQYVKKVVNCDINQFSAVAEADIGVIQGMHTVSSIGISVDVVIKTTAMDAEAPAMDLYLQQPQRPVATHYGYVHRSLPAVILNQTRPPNKV